MSVCDHDTRCGGYGGWWARVLDGGAVEWAIDPQVEDDGVGYVVCRCLTIAGSTYHD